MKAQVRLQLPGPNITVLGKHLEGGYVPVE